jgi:hypothetical protein
MDAPPPTPLDFTGIDELVEQHTSSLQILLARLHEYADLAGEHLTSMEERGVLRGLARGDGRPYRVAVNRLAARFVDQAEESCG